MIFVPFMISPANILYGYSMTTGIDFTNTLTSITYKSTENVEFMTFTRDKYQIHPTLINFHIYFNAIALIAGTIQLFSKFRSTNPLVHRVIGSVYVVGITIGIVSSLTYCKDHCYSSKEDKSYGSFVSFSCMGLSVIIPAWTGVYQIVVRKNYLCHREWMLRSYCCAVGSFSIFRILLLFLDKIPLEHQYTNWLILAWISWIIPLFCIEHYIQKERYSRMVLLWKTIFPNKSIHEMNLMFSDHQEERILLLKKSNELENVHKKSNSFSKAQ